MKALAALRAPVDTFFTDVTVNDADAVKRLNRLRLLVDDMAKQVKPRAIVVERRA